MINVGSGEEISILNLAKLILKIAKFKTKISFNSDIPDGTPRKLLNSDRMRSFGWKPETTLINGIKKTYELYTKEEKIRL